MPYAGRGMRLIVKVDAAGWLHTDDAGSLDADGRLRVHGRRGDVIVTGGEKVWPDAVEAVLATHPSVGEVAVAGVPDPQWGDRVVAWVVPRRWSAEGADGPDPTLDALRDHVRASLPAYAAPRELHLVRRLPRTALGKIERHALTAAHARDAS